MCVDHINAISAEHGTLAITFLQCVLIYRATSTRTSTVHSACVELALQDMPLADLTSFAIALATAATQRLISCNVFTSWLDVMIMPAQALDRKKTLL
jgi:hypothetical protein